MKGFRELYYSWWESNVWEWDHIHSLWVSYLNVYGVIFFALRRLYEIAKLTSKQYIATGREQHYKGAIREHKPL